MKALAKIRRERGIDMIYDAQISELKPNEVLIKINKSSICGTDVHIHEWDMWAQKTIPIPMVVGHEYSGVIVEVGSAVSSYSVGQRVSGEGHVVCGSCYHCRIGKRHLCPHTKGIGVHIAGSFAEYLVLPESNVFALPDTISDDIGAILDPFGNAMYTISNIAIMGRDVLITGAGPIGIMAAVICRHSGARHVCITDINPYRLELATRVADVVAINVAHECIADVKARLGISAFHYGVEMSGVKPSIDMLIEHVHCGADIVMLGILSDGIAINWTDVIFKSITLKGIYGRHIFDTWYRMVALIESGLDLSRLITHSISIDDYHVGFDAMISGQAGKVILNWD